METRELRVTHPQPPVQKVHRADGRGYPLSQWKIEAVNGRVWPADKGQHLFVVGFNAILDDLSPPPAGTSAPWQISLKGPLVWLWVELLLDPKVHKQHPIPKKMSWLDLTTPKLHTISDDSGLFFRVSGLQWTCWKNVPNGLNIWH